MRAYLEIEMPKSCRECPFRRETYLLTRQLCTANNDEEICSGIDTVDKSCPLVPVPPHGRLIDADAFVKSECNNCDGACEALPCDCLNCKADCRCEFMKDISEAPTIIEAEEEKENV